MSLSFGMISWLLGMLITLAQNLFLSEHKMEEGFVELAFWGFRFTLIVSSSFLVLLLIARRYTIKNFLWNLVYILLQLLLGYLLWAGIQNWAVRREKFLLFTLAWCLVQLWSFRVFLTRSDPSDSDKSQDGASSGP